MQLNIQAKHWNYVLAGDSGCLLIEGSSENWKKCSMPRETAVVDLHCNLPEGRTVLCMILRLRHHRVSCTASFGASCVEPTRFTRARHLSRSCARGSIAAGSRPSWSRSRLTTSILFLTLISSRCYKYFTLVCHDSLQRRTRTDVSCGDRSQSLLTSIIPPNQLDLLSRLLKCLLVLIFQTFRTTSNLAKEPCIKLRPQMRIQVRMLRSNISLIILRGP